MYPHMYILWASKSLCFNRINITTVAVFPLVVLKRKSGLQNNVSSYRCNLHLLEVNCDTKQFIFEQSSWMNDCVHVFYTAGSGFWSLGAHSVFFPFSSPSIFFFFFF